MKPETLPALDALRERQAAALRLNSQAGFKTGRQAEEFLSDVGVALRYHPGKGLPLASLHRATAGPSPDKAATLRALGILNELLGNAVAIEVVVVAKRVCLVHRDVVPALYALVRRGRALEDLGSVSAHGRVAFALVRDRKEVSAGDVRRHLGLRFEGRVDPGYEALAELQRLLLVDRGPFEVRTSGIPYLSQEGYPYHFLHEVHPELVRAASKLPLAEAAEVFLGRYLGGALFATEGKLASLFQAFLSRAEVGGALARMEQRGLLSLHPSGRDRLALWARARRA